MDSDLPRFTPGLAAGGICMVAHPEGQYVRAADAQSALSALREELEGARKDAALLQIILDYPETAAEELEDALMGIGTARENIESRFAPQLAALKEQR